MQKVDLDLQGKGTSAAEREISYVTAGGCTRGASEGGLEAAGVRGHRVSQIEGPTGAEVLARARREPGVVCGQIREENHGCCMVMPR